MSVPAGELDQRVAIQVASATSDGAGGSRKSWATVTTIWAKVEPMNGGEAFAQGVERATQFYRVTIRRRGGVSQKNRLLWKGVALNIRTCADMDGRNADLTMMVESGAGEP